MGAKEMSSEAIKAFIDGTITEDEYLNRIVEAGKMTLEEVE